MVNVTNLRRGWSPLFSVSKRQQLNEPISAAEARHLLEEGNKRFRTGKARHPHQNVANFTPMYQEARPFAVVFTCMDARVVPHMIFDQGINDLAVVQIAGHVIGDEVLGSIEGAVMHKNVRLVVVLGHQNCEVVAAAAKGKHLEGHIGKVTGALSPAVATARRMPGNVEENTAKVHINLTVSQLRDCQPILGKYCKSAGLGIVGAYYNLQTGYCTIYPATGVAK
jgi:carbonic anhydrase